MLSAGPCFEGLSAADGGKVYPQALLRSMGVAFPGYQSKDITAEVNRLGFGIPAQGGIDVKVRWDTRWK